MSREYVLKYTRDIPMLAMAAFVALVAVAAPDDVLETCSVCREVVRLAGHTPAVPAFGQTNPSPGVAELVLALAVLLPWCTWPWFAYWSFTCLDYSRLANMGALWRWVLLAGIAVSLRGPGTLCRVRIEQDRRSCSKRWSPARVSNLESPCPPCARSRHCCCPDCLALSVRSGRRMTRDGGWTALRPGRLRDRGRGEALEWRHVSTALITRNSARTTIARRTCVKWHRSRNR